MKPFLQKIPLLVGQSFSIRTNISKKFTGQWHYHPEIELILIVEGKGTALVGDSIINIQKNDLLLFGANLPHMFRSDEQIVIDDSVTESITIHFNYEILSAFLELPENKDLLLLLEKATVGLKITGEANKKGIELIKTMDYTQKTQRLINLLQLLSIISDSNDYDPISVSTLKVYANKQDENRLNRIYHYTLNNFQREITLKEIADIIHMTPHSFCRYFKSRTKKRYSFFLLEVRISHACKLLQESDLSIGVIAFESGFMNLSNFNRHFKQITQKTPLEYKKQFTKA